MIYRRSFQSKELKKYDDEFEMLVLMEEENDFVLYHYSKITNEVDSEKFGVLDRALKEFEKRVI